MWVSDSCVAEDESEPEGEDGSTEDAKEPRDSGCFESSENLENGREEPKTEEGTKKESSEQEETSEQQEEKQTQQLEAVPEQLEVVQEQLEELTVDEGSWEVKLLFDSWFSKSLWIET